MDALEVLEDAFGRVQESVQDLLDGLPDEALTFRPAAEANTIGWLVWHLARVQDDHVAGLAGTEQVWTKDGWSGRFGLPFPDAAHGYGQGPDDVAKVQLPGDLLVGYFDAVHDATSAYLETLKPRDLDDVVDDSWDPPVTRGVRLISVVNDDTQHVGQAAYVRGLWEKR